MISIDTNILVYAFADEDPVRQPVAIDYFEKLLFSGFPIAGQIFSEFLNVNRRKGLMSARQAQVVISRSGIYCPIVELDMSLRHSASNLSERCKIQYYDAQLLVTLARAGVRILLSEDLKDGETYGDITVLNPFNSDNVAQIALALA